MKNVSELKERYCTTIETDPTTGGKFLRLPVDNYIKLEYLRAAIASSIHYMAIHLEENSPRTPINENIMVLSELLKGLQIPSECEALDELAQ